MIRKSASSGVRSPVSGSAEGGDQDDVRVESLASCVEVEFQGNIVCTDTAEGPHPIWNQQVRNKSACIMA